MSKTFNEGLLSDSISFAIANEVRWSKDNTAPWGIHEEDLPPWNKLFGPAFPRGGVSGIIHVDGKKIVSWGDINRADLTFSVAKTYLALLCGVASEQGLIPDLDDFVVESAPNIGFESTHNRQVTWRHLLQQTSEWSGICCGIPDQVDHYRRLSFQKTDTRCHFTKGTKRELQKPGTYWEYNDVRINQLSTALLHVFLEPLDSVFERTIREPIGCRDSWSWTSYDNAFAHINNTQMPILPGGSHWGGGVRISSQDQVLIGQLISQRGCWNGEQLISEDWFDLMTSPSHLNPNYGFLTWLNTNRFLFAGLPESSIFAIGAGGSYTWIDPELNSVTVIRWIDPSCVGRFMVQVRQALEAQRK